MGNQDSPHCGTKHSCKGGYDQRNEPPIGINQGHQRNNSVFLYEEVQQRSFQ